MSQRLPEPENAGELRGLRNQIRLILRLMADPRINPLLKALPIFTLLYLVFPDLLFGPFDDAVVIGLGLYTFVELCPDEIVEEHRRELATEAGRRGQVVDADPED